MAITFDNEISLNRLIYYNASTGTFANRGATSLINFDYFEDTAGVGDYIAFGWYWAVWHDLRVYVGTPLVADSITVAWEYWNGSSWVAVPSLVDNTNAFQSSGDLTVEFPVPDNWIYQPNFGALGAAVSSACYIRCRIVSVTNLTEGGSNSTNAIEGKDWMVSLDSAGTRLSDIVAADTVGGWGVTTRNGNFYSLMANLEIPPSTSLLLRNEFFQVGDVDKRRILMLPTVGGVGGLLELGRQDGAYLVDGSFLDYYNQNGVYGVGYNSWRGTLNLYNSILNKDTGHFNDPAISGPVNIQNSVISSRERGIYFSQTVTGEIKNLTVVCGSVCRNSLFFYTSNVEPDNLIIAKASRVFVGVYNAVVNRVDFRDDYIFSPNNANVTATAKDCLFADFDSQVIIGGTKATGFIKNTLSMTIQDREGTELSGCIVRIVDGQGSEVFNGTWTGEFLATVFRKTNATGTTVSTDYRPFTLTISAPGYQTKTVVLTMDRKREEVVVLEKTVPMISAMGKTKLVNMKPSDGQNSVMWKELDTKLA
jgi:hypothetical protein